MLTYPYYIPFLGIFQTFLWVDCDFHAMNQKTEHKNYGKEYIGYTKKTKKND